MSLHRLEASQRVPVSVDQAWEFFSDPRNLARITPPNLGFTLTSAVPPHIYPGLIISYRLRPLFGVPADWVTEITQVEHQHRFIDEQRMGPYRLWHHEHTFRAVPGGTEVADLVYYALPFGPLGNVLQRAVVRQRLTHIFEYRASTLRAMFGELPSGEPAAPEQALGAPRFRPT